MAELLIVVAIIIVLAGVSFIAVHTHQRSLAQLERDAIAKEIFVAAQNHLTMAESQGYPGVGNYDKAFGSDGYIASLDDDEDKTGTVLSYENIHYFLVNGDDGVGFSSEGEPLNALDLMLPFGSLDETVRAGGSYIVRYQSSPAVVLDVFYCSLTGSPERFNHRLRADEYETLVTDYRKGAQKNYPNGVLGWYGGVEALENGEFLEEPTIEVENGERLLVRVTDPNANKDPDPATHYASIKLIIVGDTSGAKKAFDLRAGGERIPPLNTSETSGDPSDLTPANPEGASKVVYTVVLDDISTSDMKFSGLESVIAGKAFIPGENITVYAVSYSNTALTNIAYSSEITTNSLFADIRPQAEDSDDGEELGGGLTPVPDEGTATDDENIAMIGCARHLENLNDAVSGIDNDNTEDFKIVGAEQIDDLSWDNYISTIKKDKKLAEDAHVTVYVDSTPGKEDCFIPISPTYALESYDGQGHSVTGIKVDAEGPAGMFGAPAEAIRISDLELIDFDIKGTSVAASVTGEGATPAKIADAGALAGRLAAGSTVSNVLAHNSADKDSATTPTVVSVGGSAGGLIGHLVNSEDAQSKIEKCAAALIVNTSDTSTQVGNAGGLIGTMDGGTVTACYSGGHTENAAYSATNYNVTAGAGVAGGLIGSAGTATIAASYSTCSVAGASAGGFVGTADGDISGSYATGLVKGTGTKTVTIDGTEKTVADEGAFAASLTGKADKCHYFEIVNERVLKDDGDNVVGYDYLTAVPVTATNTAGTYTGVTPLDDTAETYKAFVGETSWTGDDAKPPVAGVCYDETLADYEGGKYVLPTVDRLPVDGVDVEFNAEDKTDEAGNVMAYADSVVTHYGDWPVPETFVVNTAADGHSE